MMQLYSYYTVKTSISSSWKRRLASETTGRKKVHNAISITEQHEKGMLAP